MAAERTAAGPTAAAVIERLEAHRSDAELSKYARYFKTGPGDYAEGDVFMGVRMGTVFAIAAEADTMSIPELERLLESPWHEARAAALRIMSRQSRARHTTDAHRGDLAALYLRRHDRIDDWDLVDLAAWDVVGRDLLDKPRDVLDRLAASTNLWERRTAILATMAFIRAGQLDDTYRIARVLLHDEADLIHKAVGWTLRAADGVDGPRLRGYLDDVAATMPRTMLRAAMEHFEADERAHYLGLRAASGSPRRAGPPTDRHGTGARHA